MTPRALGMLGVGLAALSGCASSPWAPGGVGALTVHAVDWNPTKAAIAGVRAVADAGSDVVAFGDGAATVLSGGRVVAVDRSVGRWISAGTLPAADGSGTWIVGVDGDGRVRRLMGKATFEPVSDRFGLADARVSAVASLGGHMAAFQLEDQVAIADGTHVARYGTGHLTAFAGGGGRAALDGATLRLFDSATKSAAAFRVPRGPSAAHLFVTVTARGKLFVATRDAIWSEDDRGDLALRYRARDAIHGLSSAADRVWFADGAELGVIESGRVRETAGAKLDARAQIVGSPSGDVWTLTEGTLARFETPSLAGPSFSATVAPVFQRVCAGCHQAGGEAGVSLATEEAWEKRREKIRQRVLVDRDMPPAPRTLSPADREAIRAWIER